LAIHCGLGGGVLALPPFSACSAEGSGNTRVVLTCPNRKTSKLSAISFRKPTFCSRQLRLQKGALNALKIYCTPR